MPIKDTDPIEEAAIADDRRTNALSGVSLHPEQKKTPKVTKSTDITPITGPQAFIRSAKKGLAQTKLSKYLPMVWSEIHTSIDEFRGHTFIHLPAEDFPETFEGETEMNNIMVNLKRYLQIWGYQCTKTYYKSGKHLHEVRTGVMVVWSGDDVSLAAIAAGHILENLENGIDHILGDLNILVHKP